ncbi:MAG TPA: YaaL family protein [Clostridia bacterium]|nr:YaaL family protein [Clostridia bacterium]
MKSAVSGLIDKVLLPQPPEALKEKPPSMLEAVEQARLEWLAARRYFETVTDPDLIDHAVYLLEAAQRKYTYVLKKARESNVRGKTSTG